MDSRGDITEVQRRAESFLYDLICRNASRSLPDQVGSIVDLAFQAQNPVRELFIKASCAGPSDFCRPPQSPRKLQPHVAQGHVAFAQHERADTPLEPVKPKTTHKLLRLPFSRDRQPKGESKHRSELHSDLPPGTTPYFEECFGPASGSYAKRTRGSSSHATSCSYVKTPVKPAAPALSAQTTEKQNKVGAPNHFVCIICSTSVSSKGVCKRHIEEQHISPKEFECEKCHHRFPTKPSAKKHSQQCGQGMTSFLPAQPVPKKRWASAFTGESFTAQERFVEHLLQLSEMPPHSRPLPSYNRKLRALLGQPALTHLCADVSVQLYGWSGAWKSLRWDNPNSAIRQLELAVVHSDDAIEFDKSLDTMPSRYNTREYLLDLFRAGKHSGRLSSAPTEFEQKSIPPEPGICQSDFDRDGTPTPTRSRSPVLEVDSKPDKEERPAPKAFSELIPEQPSRSDSLDMISLAEMKSKRHLSDHSRFYVPSRTPPGPPGSSALAFSYSVADGDAQSSAGSVSEVPQFSLCGSTSLPYRLLDHSSSFNTIVMLPASSATSSCSNSTVSHPDLTHSGYSSNATIPVLSDSASETTYAPSFQECELVSDKISMFDEYKIWTDQTGCLQEDDTRHHSTEDRVPFGSSISDLTFMPHVSSSTRASSIAGGDTIVDIPGYATAAAEQDFYQKQKMQLFATDMADGRLCQPVDIHANLSTFFLDEQGQDQYGTHQQVA